MNLTLFCWHQTQKDGKLKTSNRHLSLLRIKLSIKHTLQKEAFFGIMVYPRKKMVVHQQHLLLLEGSLNVDRPRAPCQG